MWHDHWMQMLSHPENLFIDHQYHSCDVWMYTWYMMYDVGNHCRWAHEPSWEVWELRQGESGEISELLFRPRDPCPANVSDVILTQNMLKMPVYRSEIRVKMTPSDKSLWAPSPAFSWKMPVKIQENSGGWQDDLRGISGRFRNFDEFPSDFPYYGWVVDKRKLRISPLHLFGLF